MNRKKRQTTVLIGGSNGTKTLCSILGDKSNASNEGHIIRVVTRSPNAFLNENRTPLKWTCHEQKPFSDLIPVKFFPDASWTTHLGAPDAVFGYDQIEAALSGIGTQDDGGMADIIILSCPVYAHLDILRKIAKALYNLNQKGILKTSCKEPMFIGTLYAAGGFDWMCRIAFSYEKPSHFVKWDKPLGLFGLRSFPYLTKSLEKGVVTLYGRFPQLVVACCPSTPKTRHRLNGLLERVLQCEETKIPFTFLGISSDPYNGGDGSGVGLSELNNSMADIADPHTSLGFMACTLNGTNQLLHPTICSSLFQDGEISWPVNEKTTPVPRFYADGSSPEVGRLITAIGAVEIYPILYTLDKLLAPNEMYPISTSHGGEPVGRFLLNQFGNSPADLAKRSGLTEYVMSNYSENVKISRPKLNFQFIYEFAMYFGLKNSVRLGSVPAPCIRDDKNPNILRPNVKTRFFIDDVPFGLCIVLGIAEILGFSLEKHMIETLTLVRKLQSWMNKEYVVPQNCARIVADARDVKETSAPQAFGIYSIEDLKLFMNMDPFGNNHQSFMEEKIRCSPMFGNTLNEELKIRSRL